MARWFGPRPEKVKNDWRLSNWNVREFAGKEAQLEIVDAESGGWGHINIDQIELRDTPLTDGAVVDLDAQPDYGTMNLAVVTEEPGALECVLAFGPIAGSAVGWRSSIGRTTRDGTAAEAKLRGALASSFQLAPGQSQTVTFILSLAYAQSVQQRPPRGTAVRDSSSPMPPPWPTTWARIWSV